MRGSYFCEKYTIHDINIKFEHSRTEVTTNEIKQLAKYTFNQDTNGDLLTSKAADKEFNC